MSSETEPLEFVRETRDRLNGRWRFRTKIAFVISAAGFLIIGSVAGFSLARTFTPLSQASDYERELVNGHRRAKADFEKNLAKIEDASRDAARIAQILNSKRIPTPRGQVATEERKVRVSAKPATPDIVAPENP
ncbi:MAG: hypothetical protein VXZ82_07980 [Planctomycetota bacterium]|nr:hypothetical protein [Planctomycetota bacterium]